MVQITEKDMKRGIARASNMLHMPMTRMMSRVIREEIVRAAQEREAQLTKLPCDACNGDGFVSFGDRHVENLKESCATCRGTGEIEARTGEVPEASAPLAIPKTTDPMQGSLVGKLAQPGGGVCPDPLVESVRQDLLQRSVVGLAKYGTPLATAPIDIRGFAQHAYEEALDLSNYLKCIITELDGTRVNPAQAAPATATGVPDSVRALLGKAHNALRSAKGALDEAGRREKVPGRSLKLYGAAEECEQAIFSIAEILSAHPAGQSTRLGAEPRRMPEGCCSAVSPCSHQQRDPYSLCEVCARANRLSDKVPLPRLEDTPTSNSTRTGVVGTEDIAEHIRNLQSIGRRQDANGICRKAVDAGIAALRTLAACPAAPEVPYGWVYNWTNDDRDGGVVEQKFSRVEPNAANPYISDIMPLFDVPNPAPTPVVDVVPMRLSNGKSGYFVRIKYGDRDVTPYKFSHRWQAEYEAAHFRWLFGQGDKPDLMAYGENTHPNG